MTKKKQHFVPRVYLRAFLDPTPPEGWPPDRPFEPGVWTQDPSLTGEPKRKSPDNILWKNSLYTLADDDPSFPWLEESLGRLETLYGPILDRLHQEEDLSEEQYATVALFVGALFGGVPSQLDHWQEQMDELQRVTRMVSDLPPEGVEWEDFQELGKKSLKWRSAGHAEVIGPHGFFLVNESPMAFVTSDRPARHWFLHLDDSPVRHFPQSIRAEVRPNVEAFFSFAPLSPRIAFVASPLLSPSTLYVKTQDVQLVFPLNQHMRHDVDLLISHEARPYGPITDWVVATESRLEKRPRTGVALYTPTGRYWVGTTQVTHGRGTHPLHGQMSFAAQSIEELREAAGACELVEVRVYENGQQVAGMRDAWIRSVGITLDEPSVVEDWPGGLAAWFGSDGSADGT